MTDRVVGTIRELIHYQCATIMAKSAFAASDGESRLRRWGDKQFHDAIPPLLPSAATAEARPTETIWMGTT